MAACSVRDVTWVGGLVVAAALAVAAYALRTAARRARAPAAVPDLASRQIRSATAPSPEEPAVLELLGFRHQGPLPVR